MLWVKAAHIVAMVCWFAGLFYLPRLFVYHAMTDDAAGRERFQLMERKLYRSITTPSALATVVFGAWLLALQPAWLGQGWLQLKLLLVALLIAYHIACGVFVRRFAEERNTHDHRFYRIFNELPVPILVAIVILVEVKPF